MNTTPFNMKSREEAKMLPDDRTFILKPKPGEKALKASGSVDSRIFTGENKLHAVKDIRKGCWYLRYDNGGTPEGLKGEWTEWNMLIGFVAAYFDKRNIEIVAIQ